jgi:caa(3)-type oxidase subunit IV
MKPSRKVFYRVFGVMIFLTLASMGISLLNFKGINMYLLLTFACIQACVVLFYYMDLRSSSHLTWIVAGVGFFWLGILMVLVMSDVLSRNWIPTPGW